LAATGSKATPVKFAVHGARHVCSVRRARAVVFVGRSASPGFFVALLDEGLSPKFDRPLVDLVARDVVLLGVGAYGIGPLIGALHGGES
jgi:hypothetical protein